MALTDALGIGAGEAAAILAAFLAGGLVKGALGFGLPLVTISTLPLVVPVDLALVLNALALPVLNAWQMRSAGAVGPTFRRILPLLAALVVTLPAGALMAASAPTETLTTLLGIAIMAFAALNLASPRFTIPPGRERAAAVALGAGAGVVGGITTINGPFFLVWLIGIGAERQTFRAALGILFLATGVLLTGSFAVAGLVDGPRVVAALVALMPACAGMWAGDRIARHLPVGLFRKLVLGLLIVLGANIAIRGAAL